MTDNLVYVRRKPVNSVKSGANGSVPPTSTFAKSAGVDQQASGVTATDVFANNRFIISHGKCHFWKNYAYSAEGHPYLKVSHDVRIEDIAYIMHRQWRMESPRIVALIISNVAPLQDWTNARQIAAFKKGLMKAANSTNMWIFTNGVNMGAARLIGDAVEQAIKESKAYRSSSSAANTTGHIPDVNVVGIMREDHLRYGENIDGETVNLQNEGNLMDEQKYELNDNHSHYLVVRDNTVSKTGINLFALRIIQYLSTIGGRGEFSIDLLDQSGRTSPDDYVPTIADLCSLTNTEIPIVSIVIQGGYDCARLVLEHLKRQQPVVVLRGSGGLADLLAFAYLEAQQRCRELADTLDAEYVESFLKPELSNKIVNRFPRLRDNTLARNIFRDRILECVRLARQCGCVYLSVLNMHNSACNLDNLSEYLLLALFQSRHGRHQQQPSLSNTDILLTDLYLTLDWNCPHVAATEVIGRDPSCVLRLEKAMFEQALTRADREEFVDLFMTNGFRVHKFLTPKRLRNLFKRIHRHEFFRSVCWEGVLGHSYDTDLNKEFVDIDLNWLIESCTDLRHFVQSQTLALNVMGMYATTTAAPDPAADMASAERKALFILTMWAVFGNRQKLAKVLWKHCDQPIHLGLIVSMMLERLSWFVGEQNLKTELKDPSKLFADYAIGALDLCFSRDESRANDALSEAPVEWNCKTAVDIAANARLRTFLAHPCCQKWLTNTFLGNIRLREMSWGFFSMPPSVKILLSALLVFPMYVWVRFWPKTGKQTVRDDKTEDQEDERDAMDEELHLINAQAAAGDGQKPSVGFVAALIPVPMGGALKGADDLLNKTGDELAKQGRHYQTVIKHRELLIRKQPPLFTMIYDMWNAPITKFWMFNLFYIIFLVLFSLALVWPSCGNYYLDSTVCAWTVLILVEHIRRTFVLYRKYTSVPIVFKCMEIVAIIVFVVIYASGRVFDRRIFGYYTMKVMLSFALIYFYYRLFDVHLPISPTLGPLLYRLKLMITVDFVNFMRMSALVICSSGVVIQAVLFPDEQLNLKMFRKLFHRAFFTLFNTPTDEIKADSTVNCTDNLTDNSTDSHEMYGNQTHNVCLEERVCPVGGVWPYLFSIQYFIFLKLVLITLLYALFAATASRLQTETDNIWKFQRYILVVDFAHRLPLPAPLNAFYYLYLGLKSTYRWITCYYCCRRGGTDATDGRRHRNNVMLPMSDQSDKYCENRLTEEDYNFWRHLAREYYRKEELKGEEANIAKKEWEAVQTITEEIEHEKKVLRQLKGKVTELERLMNQSHVYLESIKHLATKHWGLDMEDSGSGGGGGQTLVHFLARHSPYVGTRVQRVPIPDKYVAWEVMWIDYDPVAYSMPKMDFPAARQAMVDEDILLLQELQVEDVISKLPILQWNARCVNPAGITIDRLSWIRTADITVDGHNQHVLYKLDNGIPLNPIGRTGLRGRGALPRWGPNHYVILIITRWQSLMASNNVLEFVVENTERRDQLSLPSCFVGGECLYLDLQTLFKAGDNWTTSAEMIDFFRAAAQPSAATSATLTGLLAPAVAVTPGFKWERVAVGYLDDPYNTDNAWKEMELWHIHYTDGDCLADRMHSAYCHWRIVTEDVFTKLPPSQAQLIQDLTNKLKPNIL